MTMTHLTKTIQTINNAKTLIGCVIIKSQHKKTDK